LTARRLLVHPGPPLRGGFRAPGDKSITHRAVLLALLARGVSVVENVNPGRDCAATLACAESLGLTVLARGDARLELEGRGLETVEPERVLDCGNSGTTLRLLAGVLASQPFLAVLSGDDSLNRRPVARIIEPLTRMGARLSARDHDRYPPLVVIGASLTAIDYTLPVASAQVASAVLLAGLGARGRTSVTLPGPARDHTERMLAGLGVAIETDELPNGARRVSLEGGVAPRPLKARVPGDLSSAAFFLAAAAAVPGAEVTARDVSLNPTRTGILDVLEAMGATVRRERQRAEAGEPIGDVTVIGRERLVGFAIPAAWVPRLIDEVPAWAVAATAARGASRLTGAAELRVKESDRLSVLARNLGALGVTVREAPDGLEIEGGPVRGGAVDSASDHRIAMAFAMLGTWATDPIEVRGAENVATSFPGFVATLASLGGRIEEAAEDTAAA
jgi:3-phosphoshikimate 1-carboxyvinyltransferase